jgi:large subunit ribosomal protein L24
MSKLKITKGATVEVITGADKGKQGSVLAVDKTQMRVRIQGIKIQTRHSKKDGLVKSEGYIHYSNVKLVEAATPPKKKAAKSKSA